MKNIKNNSLFIPSHQSSYTIDRHNQQIITHDIIYEKGFPFQVNGGRLLKIDFEIANELEKYFQIKLEDFDVRIIENKFY